MSFGQRLKGLRKARNLTFAQINESSGLSTGYLSNLEAGKKVVSSLDTVDRLSIALNLPRVEFMVQTGLIDRSELPEYSVVHGNIDVLVKEAHQNAVNKGWYEDPRTFGEMIALMHSELSEALEDHRNGKGFNEIYYEGDKPCGIPTELADVVIRIFDTCGHLGIDLESAIREKMAYNATRPQRHGGKML